MSSIPQYDKSYFMIICQKNHNEIICLKNSRINKKKAKRTIIITAFKKYSDQCSVKLTKYKQYKIKKYFTKNCILIHKSIIENELINIR